MRSLRRASCGARWTTAMSPADGIPAMNAARTWTQAPLHEGIDFILATHHRQLQEHLPRLSSMAAHAVRTYGPKAPLRDVEAIVRELVFDLMTCMRKQEVVLFPAIRALED